MSQDCLKSAASHPIIEVMNQATYADQGAPIEIIDFDMISPTLRVLYVEPNAATALELRSELAAIEDKLCITHVSGALAALRKLLSDSFDCVLLNLDLPDASGLAACDAFLAHPSQLPVVVLTDRDDPTVALEAVRRGVQDWLVKDRTSPASIAQSLTFALARRNNELHLRSVRERLLDMAAKTADELAAAETEVVARLQPDATTEDRLAYVLHQLRGAIHQASTVIDEVRARLAN